MKEKTVEKRLVQAVRQHGGLALKFISPGFNGVPDRLILFPGGRLAFCEVKAPGKKLRPLQAHRMAQLRELGFRVYAVDSGRGQLAWTLRSDPRVVCMEKTNFRYFKPEDIEERADFATADVSFISLEKILPPAAAVLKAGADMVCLIKPQFEAGRDKVGKRGVVKDRDVHVEVIKKVLSYAEESGMNRRKTPIVPKISMEETSIQTDLGLSDLLSMIP